MPLIGRLGNILFQYAYLLAFAEKHGYVASMPPWVGEKIFDLPFAPRPDQYKPDLILPEETHQYQSSLIYTRKQAKRWFKLKEEHVDRLAPTLAGLPNVVLNVRKAEDGMPRVLTSCYGEAASLRGYGPDDVEFEFDITPRRHPFYDGDPTAAGLGTTWVSLPSFYFLMTAPVLFRANSTFSWWAATLGNGKVYAPVVKDLKDGRCAFAEGNWPVMAPNPPNTDLHLEEGD